MKHVAVVGAGVIGNLTAYFLARNNYVVDVFEREPYSAMQCSYANGGQISVCNAQTWNTWSNVGKGLKWMLSKDAPLLIRPKPEIDKLLWIAGFLRHTVNGSHIKNTIDTIELGKRSSALYSEISVLENLSFDKRNAGMLHVYTDVQLFEEALSYRDIFEENGVSWNFVGAFDVKKIDPGLKDFKNIVGGIHTPEDWTGDAHKFSRELERINSSSYGVRYFFNRDVIEISQSMVTARDNNSFIEQYDGYDAIILCNGFSIAKTARKFGDFLNVYPVKGYSVTIKNAAAAPAVSLLDDAKKIVSSKLGSDFRIAGTAELDGENLDIKKDRIKPLLDWCRLNFPQIDASDYKAWACLRPMNSNMMPIVSESRAKNIFYHGGHGHLGWTLGAATSQDLVSLVNRSMK